MDYPSFVNCLRQPLDACPHSPHAIWLSGLSHLRKKDRCEGTYTPSRRAVLNMANGGVLRGMLGEPRSGRNFLVSAERSLPYEVESDWPPIAEALVEMTVAAHENELGKYTICCWSKSDHESIAMWDMYCPASYGVAIRTTEHKLWNGIHTFFANSPATDIKIDAVEMGSVRYADFLNASEVDQLINIKGDEVTVPIRPMGDLLFQKALHFRHEEEYRITARHDPQSANINEEDALGHFIGLDWNHLVDEIVVHPRAPQWFLERVLADLKDAGIAVTASHSVIENGPSRETRSVRIINGRPVFEP